MNASVSALKNSQNNAVKASPYVAHAENTVKKQLNASTSSQNGDGRYSSSNYYLNAMDSSSRPNMTHSKWSDQNDLSGDSISIQSKPTSNLNDQKVYTPQLGHRDIAQRYNQRMPSSYI